LSGVFRSTDRANLEHLGFHHPRQDSLVADPRDANVLYTVGLNGVMRSLDAGRSWRIMTGWDMTEPKDIAVDPRTPDRLYIALPDGIGVSDDVGKSWRRSDTGVRRKYTQSIAIDRVENARLVVGTELGIYLSEDHARNWKLVQATTATVNDVQQSPHDGRLWFAATQSDGVLRSTDGGCTWSRIESVGTQHTLHVLRCDATAPRRLVLCGWGIGVLTTEDGGITWTPRNDGLPNLDVWCVSPDPDVPGRLYASPHGEAVYASDDFGRTWRKHWFTGAWVHDFVFVPRNGRRESP
jgi:photosystem II stability/assembly factor-like uncharacterized protein